MKYASSIILTMLLCITLTSHGQQVKPLWSKSLPKGVSWQMVTSLGNYIVGTSQGLVGIDPNKGDVMWENTKVGSLTADKVQQLGSSALLTINTGTTVYILDPFSGDIKFDSRSAGISEIKDQKVLYQSNGILVSGRTTENKDILLMSSLTDGKVSWKIEDDFGRFVTANELNSNELLIVTLYYNYLINPADGKIKWKNDVSEANKQMENMGALGGLLKQAAANMAQNIEFSVHFFKHPTKPIFFIASEQEGKPKSSGGFTTTTTSGTGPVYHTTYSAFDLTNGNSIWAKPLDLSGKIGGVYFDEKGLVIMPDDGANTKVNSYDYASQEGQWGKKGRGVNIKGGIYDFEKVKGGLVLISQNTAGKNFISYLDQTTGELTFDKPTQIDGKLLASEIVPKGLLYTTTEEVNIIDIITGKLLLDKGLHTSLSLTAQKGNVVYVFDSKDKVLKELDKTSSTAKVISSEINFEGKEVPTSIELRDNGVLISSSQNLALIGFDGKVIYQKYFEAPREPGIIRALQYAQAVRAAYIGAAAYSASAAFQSAGQQARANNEQTGGVMLEGIGSAYGELGNVASDFAKKSWQAANARFKATANANDYVVVLTKQDKNNLLVKVNKKTGASEGTIDLGKDNAPNYTMDGVTGQVFYSSGNNALVAYKF